MESIPSHGFCINCGYPLRELTAGPTGYRCPECGRSFDPANPKTFRNTPQTRFARWLAKPIEWPVVFLALTAAIGVMSVSRWKLASFAPSTVDLVYYLRPSALRHHTSILTWRDGVFTLSMLVAIGACCWWLMRLAAGLFVRPPADFAAKQKPPRAGRRHALLAIALIVTAAGATLGWPYRVAQEWAARLPRATLIQSVFLRPWVGLPPARSPDRARAILEASVIQLPQAQQREAGLKLLMENHPEMALPILLEAAGRESDSEVRALELRLIGLNRDPSTADLLLHFMTHPDANTRAAAADALGILHAPAFTISGTEYNGGVAAIAGGASIKLAKFIQLHSDLPKQEMPALPMQEIPLNPSVRDALEEMMLAGSSGEEREAAARALIAWPPANYKLRVAEWGVWINDNKEPKLLRSLLDEIPTFVHQTGNPSADFEDRLSFVAVDKPVVYITVDRPMAVDVSVVINLGRPWLAYPDPDDFTVQADDQAVLLPTSSRLYPAPSLGTLFEGVLTSPNVTLEPKPGQPCLVGLDNPSFKKLTDLRQGYPWLEPHHPTVDGDEVTGIGLRWQSLIASPTRLTWMKLPEVGADPRYAWWKRLRELPSAWVSSRGESDRFLYYDGSSVEPPAVAATLTANRLHLTIEREDEPSDQPPHPFNRLPGPPQQPTLLIHCRNGSLTGQRIDIPAPWGVEPTTIDYPLADDDLHQGRVIEKFCGMLAGAGLTPDEADGLVASWQKKFFQTDGTRLLLIMSRQDYDRFCPIDIRPKPTELARVGIVLTELQ